MSENDNYVEREEFLEKMEKLFLKIDQLKEQVSKVEYKLDKRNKMNRSFGLKSLENSQVLDFTKDVFGIGSPTKRYLLSIRAITEEWKGRKNDYLIAIRQQEKETQMDIKSLGIRIPINDIKKLRFLAEEIIALLYIGCELKGVEINDVLRDILIEINEQGPKMVKEVKDKMVFKPK